MEIFCTLLVCRVFSLLSFPPLYVYLMKDPTSLPGAEQDLLSLKEQRLDVFPVGPLVGMCTTFDQVDLNVTVIM